MCLKCTGRYVITSVLVACQSTAIQGNSYMGCFLETNLVRFTCGLCSELSDV